MSAVISGFSWEPDVLALAEQLDANHGLPLARTPCRTPRKVGRRSVGSSAPHFVGADLLLGRTCGSARAPPSHQTGRSATYGRGKDQHPMVPGWPYSIVAALETDATSWTALLEPPGRPGRGRHDRRDVAGVRRHHRRAGRPAAWHLERFELAAEQRSRHRRIVRRWLARCVRGEVERNPAVATRCDKLAVRPLLPFGEVRPIQARWLVGPICKSCYDRVLATPSASVRTLLDQVQYCWSAESRPGRMGEARQGTLDRSGSRRPGHAC
jgi:hypothetical protein